MPHTLFVLDVRLREIEPAIWRTLELPGTSSLEEVHFAIQVAMGWTNSHLHQFMIGKTAYGMADGDEALEVEDERQFKLLDLVRSGETVVYEYDFGDGWEHAVTLAKIATQAKPPRPRCVGGARACPPEDCGGPGGYATLLEALRDPKHPEHESSVTWSGNFQPERFSIPKTGLDLRTAMDELLAMANEDDALEQPNDEANDVLGLPTALVNSVLALEPTQRAALSAVIAGSLANELVEVHALATRLADAFEKTQQHKPAHGGRKRARS